jgi:hypothetical protein
VSNTVDRGLSQGGHSVTHPPIHCVYRSTETLRSPPRASLTALAQTEQLLSACLHVFAPAGCLQYPAMERPRSSLYLHRRPLTRPSYSPPCVRVRVRRRRRRAGAGDYTPFCKAQIKVLWAGRDAGPAGCERPDLRSGRSKGPGSLPGTAVCTPAKQQSYQHSSKSRHLQTDKFLVQRQARP